MPLGCKAVSAHFKCIYLKLHEEENGYWLLPNITDNYQIGTYSVGIPNHYIAVLQSSTSHGQHIFFDVAAGGFKHV